MDKNSISEFGSENISDRFSDEFSGMDTSDSAKQKKPEAVIRKNKDFTDKFDIPLKTDDAGKDTAETESENENVTQAKDISTSSKPSQIIQNPEDNIRYMQKKQKDKKEKKKLKSAFPAKNDGKPKNIYDEIKLMINNRETESPKQFSLPDFNGIKENFLLKKEQHKKKKKRKPSS